MSLLSRIDRIGSRSGFWLVALVPTLCLLLYLWVLAAPVYQSETQFLVRENRDSGGPPVPGFAAALFGGGSRTSLEDAHILAQYLHSNDVLDQLEHSLGLREHYRSPALDWFRRLRGNDTREAFRDYYRRQVSVSIAPDSHIVTLAVRTFDPAFSLAVAHKLIELSEVKINRMNDRILESRTTTGKTELLRAEKSLLASRERLLAFQIEHAVVDPVTHASSHFGLIASLDARIMEKQAELGTKNQFLREGSTELRQLEQGIRALQAQRDQEILKLASEDDDSLASLLFQYERLRLENEFALNAYTTAFALVEQANLSAVRQEKFILMVARPDLPEAPSSPRPVRDSAALFLVLCLLFASGKMILATIKDHAI